MQQTEGACKTMSEQEAYTSLVYRVLFTPGYLEIIAGFQNGMCDDFARFVDVTPPRLVRHNKKRVNFRAANCDFHHKVGEAYKALMYWLPEHGMERLPKLIAWMPHLGLVTTLVAISYNNSTLLEYLHRKFGLETLCEDVLDVAAFADNIAIFKQLESYGFAPTTNECLNFAVENGNLEMVIYLTHNYPHSTASIDSLIVGIKRFHFDPVLYVTMHDPQLLADTTMPLSTRFSHAAVETGQIRTLKVVEELGFMFLPSTVDKAASLGHLHIVQWLLEEKRAPGHTSRAMNEAAGNGHLEVVKYLHARNTNACTPDAMDMAAGNGHLHVVQWLHENRTEGCTVNAFNLAAGNNHLAVVQWLVHHRREGGSAHAMDLAAKNGHLEMVQWLHHNTNYGCTPRAVDRAVQANHVQVAMWLLQNRREGCSKYVVERAVHSGNLEMLQWLYSNIPNVQFEEPLVVAAERGYVDILAWLYDIGEVDRAYLTHPIVRAAQCGQREAVLWFLRTGRGGCRWCGSRAADRANYDLMAKWLDTAATGTKPCRSCHTDDIDDNDGDDLESNQSDLSNDMDDDSDME
ncbi:hypothetical protein LEN26_009107 [Aphanomyces euteiches]|nr:hypothetical protein LEN26_009107 [Aphanomyces euteiches]